MLKGKEIEETFREFGLLSERDRQEILSQGIVLTQTKEKPIYWLITDSVTTFDALKELRNVRLE